MFTTREWRYITSLKSLTRDEYGRMWAADCKLNGFLLYLPWWAKDRIVDKTCLLYQVDSKGQLFILCIVHVWKIQTSSKGMLIIYKTDARHARLEYHYVPKGHWGHVGLMTIYPYGGAHVAPKLSFGPPQTQNNCEDALVSSESNHQGSKHCEKK